MHTVNGQTQKRNVLVKGNKNKRVSTRMETNEVLTYIKADPRYSLVCYREPTVLNCLRSST